MNNTTFEPRSGVKSGSLHAEELSIFKKKLPHRWETSRKVPESLLAARRREEIKQEITERVDQSRAKTTVLGVLCRKTKTGFKAIGLGREFATFNEVKDFARGLGRGFVKMGAIRAKV